MPIQSIRRERPLIELFLSAYDNGAWQCASLDWLEDRQDSAVEVLATARNGETLAVEHTLIQPFAGEKQDSDRFLKTFLRINGDRSLIIAEQDIDVAIPVGTVSSGYDWDFIGEEVLSCLVERRQSLSEGTSRHPCTVGRGSKKGPFTITLQVSVTSMPGTPGACRIMRYDAPKNLGDVVERALRMKLPKLVATPANRRILLLERDQIFPSFLEIYAEIEKREAGFADLKQVDTIWFANTAGLETSQFVMFSLIDQRGLVELLSFHNDVLTLRRNDRPLLPCLPPGAKASWNHAV
jgi:hypothetical protein